MVSNKDIPTLTGESAERFLTQAEENLKRGPSIDFSKELKEWRDFLEKNKARQSNEPRVYFVSGHRDITQEEFDRLYAPAILEAISKHGPNTFFVIGDYYGVDYMAQTFILDIINKKGVIAPENVTVYHMFKAPMHIASSLFNKKGGYQSDEERDAAMTKESDEDIAFVRKGKRDSGTAQNIIRRYEFE